MHLFQYLPSQVAHNVEVGRGCILVAQSGVAGSTHLGNGVILAGQAWSGRTYTRGRWHHRDGTNWRDQGRNAWLCPDGHSWQDRKAFARDRLLLKKFEAMEPDLKALIKKAKEE